MREVKAYVCEFCPRSRARILMSSAKRHESKCRRNPANRACLTCANFSNGEGWYDVMRHDGPDEKSYRTNICELELLPSDVELVSNCEKWKPCPSKVEREAQS